jgi:hydrogenase maturation protease
MTGVTGTGDPAAVFIPPRYVVLGLGNRLETDEALGALVIEQLQAQPELLAGLPDAASVDLIDGGTVGLALLPYLMGLDGLIVVDAINANCEPGTLIDLDGASLIRHEQVMSVHDLGAGELLGALHVLEAWPRRVRVIGLEPQAIQLGLELTPAVAAGVPGLLDAVRAHLLEWQRADG